nr:type VI secretion system-associated FHA domain protein [Leisingera aquaemixtae]
MKDIKAHEVAMVTGMEAALKGVLKRLDPKALEAQIEDKGGFSGLLRGKKARYWTFTSSFMRRFPTRLRMIFTTCSAANSRGLTSSSWTGLKDG